jgi:Na+/melibiose symporter-like transporter
LKLKRSTLFFYGLTELPINISLFPVLVFIPKFYSVDMGVSLVLAANIILAVRLFDVITDPLFVFDRTIQGRLFPHLVLVLSLIYPNKGSVITSKRRTAKMILAAKTKDTPISTE